MKLKNLILFCNFLIVSLICPDYAACFPTIPARIFGEISINNKQLTDTTAQGYTILVTNLSEEPYTPSAEDTDGLEGGLYLIDIPIYDANDQPGGAKPDEQAKIHLFRKGNKTEIISPSGGLIIVGAEGSFTMVTITAVYNLSSYKQVLSGGEQTNKKLIIKTGGGHSSSKLMKVKY